MATAYDFILIDGAAGVGPMAAATVRSVDLILIPVQPAFKDLESTSDTVALVKNEQVDGAPRAIFVMTQSDPKEKITRDFADALLKFGFDVLDSQLQRRSTHKAADLESKTAIEYRPKSHAAADARAILNELITEKVISL